MKLFDEVRVKNNKYSKYNVFKGMVGTIIDAGIMFRAFQVCFVDERTKKEGFDYENDKWEDIVEYIEIADLEIVNESDVTDEYILENLPNQNPICFCKVVDGYIVNLKGDKLNKVPFDYSS